jgi:outer membrane protein OmpA-like peptidoglycan-associated protein
MTLASIQRRLAWRSTGWAALACMLTACSTAPKAVSTEPPLANMQAERISDERIVAERQALESLQWRLKKLNDDGVPAKNYTFAKAQCWLDTAKTQYHENDRTGYIEEAMEQSIALIRALETDKATSAGAETPLIAKSDKLRDDLWARLSALRSRPGFECAAQTVACAEVRLVRAGHANQQTGWRQASPHIAMAEDATRQAEREEAGCVKPSIVPVAEAKKGEAASTAASNQSERFVLLSDTLFAFDKSDLAHMLPAGRARLQAVAQKLQSYARIERLTVLGYTDRLGGDDYNLKLSQARAETVLAYLQSLGVKAEKVEAVGKGKSATVSAGCGEALPRAAQIACLQPDRRVEIEASGVVRR